MRDLGLERGVVVYCSGKGNTREDCLFTAGAGNPRKE
jgi:hypothetical protein